MVTHRNMDDCFISSNDLTNVGKRINGNPVEGRMFSPGISRAKEAECTVRLMDRCQAASAAWK